MTIPDNFELAPVKAGSHPPPAPPKCSKKQLYNHLDAETKFGTVDNHAVEEAKLNYSNFRDLIWNLIFKNDFTELEKARVIFRWMTSKDLTTIEFESEKPSIPERLLNAFKTGNGSYARTFEYVARYAGLHCVAISGWAKGAEYRPGDPITSGPANHSWNAVYIDGGWQLVDCHWSSRYLRTDGESTSTDSDNKFGYEYDDFYFLTDPEQMIFSHLPVDEKWQLMDNTWTSDEFEQRAYIKSQFFTLGLQLMPENSGVIVAEAGLATLSLSFDSKIAFTYRFRHEDGSDEVKNLSRYVLQEMTDHRLTYFIRTPLPGSYVLTVFAREFLDDITPKSMITFKSVAEYKVINQEESDETFQPFPYCSDSSWGLDMYTSFSGRLLFPQHRMAVLFCPDGHGEIKISRHGSTMRLYARLVKEGIAFEVLKSCVTIEDQEEVAAVIVDLPELGEFGLEVFVNDPHKDGKLFSHFCQYLCTTETVGRFSEVYESTRDPRDVGESFEVDAVAEKTSSNEIVEEAVQAVTQSKVCASLEVEAEADAEENVVGEKLEDNETSQEPNEDVNAAVDSTWDEKSQQVGENAPDMHDSEEIQEVISADIAKTAERPVASVDQDEMITDKTDTTEDRHVEDDTEHDSDKAINEDVEIADQKYEVAEHIPPPQECADAAELPDEKCDEVDEADYVQPFAPHENNEDVEEKVPEANVVAELYDSKETHDDNEKSEVDADSRPTYDENVSSDKDYSSEKNNDSLDNHERGGDDRQNIQDETEESVDSEEPFDGHIKSHEQITPVDSKDEAGELSVSNTDNEDHREKISDESLAEHDSEEGCISHTVEQANAAEGTSPEQLEESSKSVDDGDAHTKTTSEGECVELHSQSEQENNQSAEISADDNEAGVEEESKLISDETQEIEQRISESNFVQSFSHAVTDDVSASGNDEESAYPQRLSAGDDEKTRRNFEESEEVDANQEQNEDENIPAITDTLEDDHHKNEKSYEDSLVEETCEEADPIESVERDEENKSEPKELSPSVQSLAIVDISQKESDALDADEQVNDGQDLVQHVALEQQSFAETADTRVTEELQKSSQEHDDHHDLVKEHVIADKDETTENVEEVSESSIAPEEAHAAECFKTLDEDQSQTKSDENQEESTAEVADAEIEGETEQLPEPTGNEYKSDDDQGTEDVKDRITEVADDVKDTVDEIVGHLDKDTRTLNDSHDDNEAVEPQDQTENSEIINSAEQFKEATFETPLENKKDWQIDEADGTIAAESHVAVNQNDSDRVQSGQAASEQESVSQEYSSDVNAERQEPSVQTSEESEISALSKDHDDTAPEATSTADEATFQSNIKSEEEPCDSQQVDLETDKISHDLEDSDEPRVQPGDSNVEEGLLSEEKHMPEEHENDQQEPEEQEITEVLPTTDEAQTHHDEQHKIDTKDVENLEEIREAAELKENDEALSAVDTAGSVTEAPTDQRESESTEESRLLDDDFDQKSTKKTSEESLNHDFPVADENHLSENVAADQSSPAHEKLDENDAERDEEKQDKTCAIEHDSSKEHPEGHDQRTVVDELRKQQESSALTEDDISSEAFESVQPLQDQQSCREPIELSDKPEVHQQDSHDTHADEESLRETLARESVSEADEHPTDVSDLTDGGKNLLGIAKDEEAVHEESLRTVVESDGIDTTQYHEQPLDDEGSTNKDSEAYKPSEDSENASTEESEQVRKDEDSSSKEVGLHKQDEDAESLAVADQGDDKEIDHADTAIHSHEPESVEKTALKQTEDAYDIEVQKPLERFEGVQEDNDQRENDSTAVEVKSANVPADTSVEELDAVDTTLHAEVAEDVEVVRISKLSHAEKLDSLISSLVHEESSDANFDQPDKEEESMSSSISVPLHQDKEPDSDSDRADAYSIEDTVTKESENDHQDDEQGHNITAIADDRQEVSESMELVTVSKEHCYPENLDNLIASLEEENFSAERETEEADVSESVLLDDTTADITQQLEAHDHEREIEHKNEVEVDKKHSIAVEEERKDADDADINKDDLGASDESSENVHPVDSIVPEIEKENEVISPKDEQHAEETKTPLRETDANVPQQDDSEETVEGSEFAAEKSTANDDDQDVDKEVELLTDSGRQSEPTTESGAAVDYQPPADFHLEPIRDKLSIGAKISLSEATLKPFEDVKVFGDVDSHASEVSQELHSSYRNLVWHLIHARGIESDLEKARAVFVYLCSKDLNKVNVDEIDDESPDMLFASLQQGETTYARVFETLCCNVGLHCEAVNGYAKGADYRPGMHFDGIDGQHSWNVVLIDGTWRLVDCHWAARRLVGKQVSEDNVRYELDEYYFMPDPRQLIFTHFPQEERWQLLENPLTLEEFEDLVPVKSTFFKLNLQLLSHRNAVVDVDREQTIVLGCPPAELGKRLVFTFTLTSDELGDTCNGTDLSQFGMQHIVDGSESHFVIRPPQTGTYQLVIYAKEQRQTDAPFGGVCEYQLVCRQSYPRPMAYPPCAHTTWGAGDSAALYPLTPLHGAGAIVEASDDGIAEIRLQMEAELRFSARLKSVDSKDEEALSKYVLTRVVGDVAIILVRLPNIGEFGLEIYANNPLTDGQSLRHAYQMLIICRQLSSGYPEAFPVMPASYLGPQPIFKTLGLALSSDSADPYIVVDDGCTRLLFTPSTPVRLTAQLIDCSAATSADSDDDGEYVLQQSASDGSIAFIVRLPKKGFFKLQVFGAPFTSEPVESLPGIYNFLIYCRHVELGSAAAEFPRQYAAWRDGCYLYEPIDNKLKPLDQPIQFKVQVPLAASVAVVIGSEWIMLDKNENGLWSGAITIGKHSNGDKKVSVCAAYDSSTDSYSTLLEYRI